jgi:hypothetical protein
MREPLTRGIKKKCVLFDRRFQARTERKHLNRRESGCVVYHLCCRSEWGPISNRRPAALRRPKTVGPRACAASDPWESSPIPFAGTAFIALLVLVWARLSRTPLAEIGYVAPRSWTRAIAGGFVFGLVFKLVMKAVVLPLLGAAPVNQTYHYLAGNAPATAAMAVFVTLSGGFGEETVYRGFLFKRFCTLFGSRAHASYDDIATAGKDGSKIFWAIDAAP